MPASAAGAAAGATTNTTSRKYESALSFLAEVKLQFARNLKVYNQFLDIMTEFNHRKIDTPGVMTRVSELFADHDQLLLGFNTFLPVGFSIVIDDYGQIKLITPRANGA